MQYHVAGSNGMVPAPFQNWIKHSRSVRIRIGPVFNPGLNIMQ